MAGEIELSIAETNKLRAQLELPLIPDPSDTPNPPKETASTSFSTDSANRLRASLGLRPVRKTEQDVLREKGTIEKSSRAAKQTTQLADDLFYNEVDLTETWLQNIGKKKRNESGKTEKFALGDDTADTEADLRVAHGADAVDALKEGDVLTLEDGDIKDDETDGVLANDQLKRQNKQKHDDLERKKQALLEYGLRPDFGVDTENEPEGEMKMVGNTIVGTKLTDKDPKPEIRGNLQTVSFDFDDLDEPKAHIPMKKLKKKTKKSNKRARQDEESIDFTGPMTTATLAVEDDEADDLELILATSRAAKQKRRKILTAEEIATEVKMHLRVDAVTSLTEGFVYDDTKDFLDTLTRRATDQGTQADGKASASEEEATHDQEQPQENAKSNEVAERSEVAESSEATETSEAPETETKEEDRSAPQFNTLLDTLKYLRQQDTQAESQDSQREKALRQAYRDAELSRIKISIEERIVREELAKDHSYTSLPADEKEKLFDRVLNDRLVAKGIVAEVAKGKYSRYNSKDALSSYNPKVSLKYTDSSGQVLDTKQAWKHLLHKYHGLEPKHKKRKLVRGDSNESVIG